jgi:ADP-ribose pyrophosphatase YjhB (NUDIX family)
MTLIVPDCFYRISVKAIILNDTNKFMLVKEDNGLWELPGGGLDFGESPQEGLRREIWEEMGLNTSFIAHQPSYFFTCINHKGVHISNVVYETRLEHEHFTPSPECVEIRYFSPEEVLSEKNMYPNVVAFAKILDKNT